MNSQNTKMLLQSLQHILSANKSRYFRKYLDTLTDSDTECKKTKSFKKKNN